jgi:signal peptidase II
LKLFLTSFSIVIVDQLSKLFIKGFSLSFLHVNVKGLSYGQQIPVISGFFNITFIENPGIAFGIDPGSKFKLFISVLTIFVIFGLVVYLFFLKDKDFSFRLSIAIILGGAVGNLMDRMFYGIFYGYASFLNGKVVDFLDFGILNLFFHQDVFSNYVFNFADVAVTFGVIMFVYNFHKKNIRVSRKNIELGNYLTEGKK